jgi:hypothetical protein
MIQQLVTRLAAQSGTLPEQEAGRVLTADPLDLVLEMEEVWDRANLFSPNTGPAGHTGPAGPARLTLMGTGEFHDPANPPANAPGNPNAPAYHHLGYAFAIESTRVAQIMARVVRLFRSGEALGIPSYATQRWLDTTETLLFSAAYPFAAWMSTSLIRPDAEAVRRNAYYRLFGMDLAHGTDSNAPYAYEKPETANRTFVPLFQELLYELWKAIENVRNLVGPNQSDDDRIFRLAEQLSFVLRSRRQNALLGREELAAVTAMGWYDLTLSTNNPIIRDLRADAPTQSDRLRIIGERVGLAPHSKAASFFSMAEELSLFLRNIEARVVGGPAQSWILYRDAPAPAIGAAVRRVITEWSAASGQDLKARARPAEVRSTDGRVLTRN